MKKLWIILILFLVAPCLAHAEDLLDNMPLRAYLIGDPSTGQVLDSFNIDEPMEIASISKVMTYYVVKDAIKQGEISLQDSCIISENAASIGGSSFELVAGEEVTVEELLDGLMIVSGNDAAVALAEKVAGTEANFAQRMIEKAEALGFKNYHLINASGLFDEREDQNKVRPRDLFVLATKVIEDYPEILEYSKRSELNIPRRKFHQKSTMGLFGKYPGVDGLKTGYTEDAGYCLLNTVNMDQTEAPEDDYRLVTVVMGAYTQSSRFDLTERLMNYAKNKYSMREVVKKGEALGTLPTSGMEEIEVPITAQDAYKCLVKKDTRISLQYDVDRILKPVEEGEVVGNVIIYEDGNEVKKIPLQVTQSLHQAKIKTRLYRLFGFWKEKFQNLWNYAKM